ncbi:DUF6932 family protein [Stomatohabitans albus]|uniref:DUF6932 family protein n=1 Tax=Stomatohabitans albus TaxID=3110766 RepID=UPI00300D1C92
MGYLPDYTDQGFLPIGRWQANSLEDIANKYISEDDYHRQRLWKEWAELTSLAKSAYGYIIACWLGGSFFTTKPDPEDIDCVYIIADKAFTNPIEPDHASIFQAIWRKGKHSVDIQVLRFRPFLGDEPIPSPERDYVRERGQWDEYWSKYRDKSLIIHKDKQAAYPSRGYLEVMIDGYPRPE